MTDWMLLREFLDHRSEAAFATLVQRHLGLVYGVALRELGDAHLAQDVSQAVFVLLTRKAEAFDSRLILPGWLHRTAVFLARRVRRDQVQRVRLEREMLPMMNPPDSDHAPWEVLAPHLDDALNQLGETDRHAVILRHLQQQSFCEVGGALGMSEEAAKKRVSRALEKLRQQLQARGIRVSAGMVGAAMSVRGIPGIPEGLAEATLQAAFSADRLAAGALLGSGRGWDWIAALPRIARTVGTLVAIASVAVILMLYWKSDSGVRDARVAGLDTMEMPNATGSREPLAEASGVGGTATRLRVVAAENDEPLKGVWVSVAFRGKPQITLDVETDSEGWVTIPHPGRRFEGMFLGAYAPGRVPLGASWRRQEGPSLPQEYVLKLEVGRPVSGRVMDPQGRAVGGAAVTFQGRGLPWDSRESEHYRHPVPPTVTDAQGRWTVDFLHPDAKRVSGRVEHPDFAATPLLVDVSEDQELVLTLQPGYRVAGRLQDDQGVAVAGAGVKLEAVSGGLETLADTSDSKGRFEWPRVAQGEYRLTAKAQGGLPAEVAVIVESADINQDVTVQWLPVGGSSILRGRVVSDQGEAIYGQVSYRGGPDASSKLAWSQPLDADGRWAWNAAPNQAVALEFHVERHQPTTVILSPQAEEHQTVARWIPEVLVRGTVVARADGQPVPRFKVLRVGAMAFRLLCEGFDGEFAMHEWPDEFESKENRYRPGHPLYTTGYQLKIVAEGFRPRTILIPPVKEGEVAVTVELDPETIVQRLVLQPDGTPARGASVSYRGPGMKILLLEPEIFGERGTDRGWRGQAKAETGEEGQFQLPLVDGATRIAAVHASGWADESFDKNSTAPIRLRPWGRVEGLLQTGGHPVPHATVQLDSVGSHLEQLPFANFTAQTDAQGRFVFPKVPPGVALVRQSLQAGNLGLLSHAAEISVRPGDTAQLVIGGAGARLEGRFVVSDVGAAVDWTRSTVQIRSGEETVTSGESLRAGREFGTFCRSDGSFTLEDIPAGQYRMFCELRPPRAGRTEVNAGSVVLEDLQTLKKTLSLSVPDEDSTDGVMDLGVIEVTMASDP